MKYPDFIKTTGKECPVHRVPTYMFGGKERCPGCDQHRVDKDYLQKVKDNCNDELMKTYNNDKYHKGKSALERSEGDVVANIGKGLFK